MAQQSHLLLLVVIIIISSLASPVFFTASNFTNIMVQIPYYAIMAYGMTICIIAKGIDLSIGSNMALSCCIAASFLVDGKIVQGILAGCAVGMAIGFSNGFLIAKLKLPPFIATYCMDWITKGIAYVFMMGSILYPFPDSFRSVATGTVFGMSTIVVVMIAITILMYLLTKKTVFGRNLYALGSNDVAAKFSGMKTEHTTYLVYTLSGLMAAIGGLLLIARMNAADANYEEGWNIKLIAATLIGGTVMKGGIGGVERTFVGVLIITIIYNILNLLGLSSLWQQLVVGLVIMLSIVTSLLSDYVTKVTTVKG